MISDVQPPPESTGILIAYTGQGKGKTTAALGLAFRAMGRQQRVAMVQFLKGKWLTGERIMAEKMPLLDLEVMGQGFTWDSEDISRDRRAARLAWQKCIDYIYGNDHPVIICDEISYAMNYGFISEKEVCQVLKERPNDKHVVLTGRHMPAPLLEMADLVSEINSIKHPFSKGQRAIKGIDY